MVVALLLAVLAAPPAGADEPSSVDRGRTLYTAKCMACHGKTGAGDGAAARALPRPPPDMTSEAFWEGRTDEDLRSVLRNGIPGGVMRAFPMPDPSATDLIAYLRTLKQA